MMTTTTKNAIIYLPADPDAMDRWEVTAAALRAAGVKDIRPAPVAAQTFRPRLSFPILLCSSEV